MLRKISIALLALLLNLAGAAAQVDQHGSVTLYDSGSTPLAGVQVMSKGAPATDTDQQGAFVLHFPDKSPGTAIFADLYKKGYEVVNCDEVSRFILSRKSSLKAVMAPVGTVESVKMKYYGIASENYSRKYSAAMQEINDLYNAREITLEQRRVSLDSLNRESEIYWNRLEHYTEKFARINPDDVEGVDKMALEAVKKGDLEKAVKIYEDARVVEQSLAKIQVREGLEEDIQALAQSLQRYSDLCAIVGGWEYQKKSRDVKKRLAELFPDDFYVVRDYVNSLSVFDEDALGLYDGLIGIASDDFDLVAAVHDKADFMRRTGDYDDALNTYLSSLEVSSELFNKESSYSSLYLVLQCMSSMMLLAQTTGNHEFVLVVGQEALDLLDGVEVEEFDLIRLSMMNSMVESCYSQKDWKMYEEMTDTRYDFMKRMESEGVVDMEGLDAEFVLLNEKMRYATASGDIESMYKYNKESLKLLEPLFKKDPESYMSAYVSSLEVYFQRMINDYPSQAVDLAGEYEKMVRDEILPYLDEVAVCEAMYNVEYLYVWYYQKHSMFAESYPHVRKMNEYADVLEERALYDNVFAVITSRCKRVEMLIRQQDDALTEAVLELQSLYDHVKEVRRFEDTTAESDIAAGYYVTGEYQQALDYFDMVRAAREAILKEFPDNYEVKANLTSTYHNMAGCLSALKRDSEALTTVRKSIDMIADLYPLRPASYGPNYFQYLGNATAMAHWAGNGRQAEKFLEMQRKLAYDLASRGKTFESFPYAYRLFEHDYLQATGKKVNSKEYKDVLEYKSGTLKNDWILMNLVRTRNKNGNVFNR